MHLVWCLVATLVSSSGISPENLFSLLSPPHTVKWNYRPSARQTEMSSMIKSPQDRTLLLFCMWTIMLIKCRMLSPCLHVKCRVCDNCCKGSTNWNKTGDVESFWWNLSIRMRQKCSQTSLCSKVWSTLCLVSFAGFLPHSLTFSEKS